MNRKDTFGCPSLLWYTDLGMEESGWAAGLFEGEGSVIITPKGYVHLQLSMVDEDVVERFCNLVGGRLYSYQELSSGKTYHRATVSKSDQAVRVGLQMTPWLGNRRLKVVADASEMNMLRHEFGTANRGKW